MNRNTLEAESGRRWSHGERRAARISAPRKRMLNGWDRSRAVKLPKLWATRACTGLSASQWYGRHSAESRWRALLAGTPVICVATGRHGRGFAKTGKRGCCSRPENAADLARQTALGIRSSSRSEGNAACRASALRSQIHDASELPRTHRYLSGRKEACRGEQNGRGCTAT